MSQYLVEIDPSLSLADVTNRVRFEEASSAKFIKCEIGFHGGRVTNLVTFEDLPRGQVPADIVFASGAAPAGALWAGVMVVGGTNTAVFARRLG